MVDVSAKPETERRAIATGRIAMSREAAAAIGAGDVPKGDVLAVARVAGIMAAKRTSELIPLCHPLMLSAVAVDLAAEPPDTVRITATCRLAGQTGVEMEALTAASVAALTLFDMYKAVDRAMVIEAVRLLEKTGGKSGDFHAGDAASGDSA